MICILTEKLDAIIEEKLDGLITEKIDEAVKKIIVKLDEKDEKIEELKQENITMKRDIQELGERVDDLESEKLKNTLIISGEVLPCASGGEVVSYVTPDLPKNQLKIEVPLDDISSAYRIGSRPSTQGPDTRSIAVRLSRDDLTFDIRQACRTLKPNKLFVNESLTPARRKFLYILRQLKRRFPDKLSACGSQGGRVYVWVKSPNSSARDTKVFINKRSTMDDFCRRLTGVDSTEFLEPRAPQGSNRK